ncbi:MAG: preprotein translocase subunit SecY [Candidatus Wolfebacteria bacterium]|nr:preprotein translocase subunit SecY [Candidatus Wolfebacteria bacterium]
MERFLQIFKIKDLRKKVFIVGGLLVVYRILAAIPVPGVDSSKIKDILSSNQLLGFFNVFSGGALSNLSIIMLSVAPYITSTIIMQLLTMIFPNLKAMYYEEGSAGRAKFNRLSRYITVPLAAVQAYGFINILTSQGLISPLSPFDLIRNVIIITAGSLVVMWIGELISEQKIGNGISFIIFAGIVSSLPREAQQLVLNWNSGTIRIDLILLFLAVAILVIGGVVFIQEGERRIPVSYAKRVRGNKLYGGASSYLPLKVNQAGVIPIIFAISILLFPQFIAQFATIISPSLAVKLNVIVTQFFNNQLIYGIIYFLLVVVFTYFYTAVTFDPKEISKNLQRAGGFIAGIRPGESTTDYLGKVINRITFSGALFLGIIAILPNITQAFTGVSSLSVGGTALLIVVAVALDTARQINSQLIMREYEGFN